MSNPGRNLQANWRWNGRPLRVRNEQLKQFEWRIAWERWQRGGWTKWRAYIGTGTLRQVCYRYRDYAYGWRGFE